jgi:hypothetical protein
VGVALLCTCQPPVPNVSVWADPFADSFDTATTVATVNNAATTKSPTA